MLLDMHSQHSVPQGVRDSKYMHRYVLRDGDIFVPSQMELLSAVQPGWRSRAGQAEHLCSQMLGVSIYKASRNPVVFINDLRGTASLQMAGYSENRDVQMLHAGMSQFCSCEDLLP